MSVQLLIVFVVVVTGNIEEVMLVIILCFHNRNYMKVYSMHLIATVPQPMDLTPSGSDGDLPGTF